MLPRAYEGRKEREKRKNTEESQYALGDEQLPPFHSSTWLPRFPLEYYPEPVVPLV